MNGSPDRMTSAKDLENRPSGAAVAQPGRETGSDRCKTRNRARDAAKAAAAAVRANTEVEDKETAEAIRKARKEAGK